MAEKMTSVQIESAAVEAMRTALGGPDSDVGRSRLRNLRAFNAEPTEEFAPSEVADRSDFVDTTVRDTVNGMLPQLMRMFISSDNAVEFEGQGQPGSDEQAKLATAYVNHLFYTRNDGVGVLSDWFKDALLQKVGFVKVWAEDYSEDAKQKYEGNTPDQLAMLMQDGWTLDGDPEVDDDGTLSFVVTKEARSRRIRVMACSPSQMRIDVNARWDDEPAMIGQSMYRRKFELEEEGFDLTDVASGEDPSDSETLEQLGETWGSASGPPHDSHALIRYDECYIKLDADGDGVSEWLKVVLLNEKLAIIDSSESWEQVDDHPFVWTCPTPRPHSFFGDCPADYAYGPQKMRTNVIRAIDDNLMFSVNQRMYVNTSANVNIDDVLDSRPGGLIRGEGSAADAITPIQAPAILAPAYQFNEYLGSWAENATGFNRYSAGTDQNALNKTARGTELLTAKADMRMELIARYFAVGVKNLFAKLLKLSIQHQNVTEMVRINQQFVPINPSEFRNQFSLKINVGLGNGSKEQQMARLMGVSQMMTQLGLPAGVVRPQQIAELIKLAIELNEFKNPERFVDAEPSGMPPTPQAYQQEKQGAMQQMQQMQVQLQQLGSENAALKMQAKDKAGDLQLKAHEQEREDYVAKNEQERENFVARQPSLEQQEITRLSAQVQALAEIVLGGMPA